MWLIRWVITGLVFGTLLSVGSVYLGVTTFVGPGRTNILVLGVDQRTEQRGSDPGRTDTLMLVSVDGRSRSAALVSIPRDLWVEIPGHGEGRINTAYRQGELTRSGGGAALARRTVEAALGVGVDRYIVVDMEALSGLIDHLGGVTLDVREPLVDEAYPTADGRARRIEIPAGRQRLSGELALAYARSRRQDDDFGRMARQQQLLAALREEASKSPPNELIAMLGAVPGAFRTDLSPAELLSLGRTARELADSRVRRLVIGRDLADPVVGTDGAALLQPRPGLRAAVAEVMRPPS